MKKTINKKFIIGIVIGIIFGGLTGVIAYSISADSISYDNTTSGLTSTNAKGAIDELSAKCTNGEKVVYRWGQTQWNNNQDISSFTPGTDYVKKKSEVVNMNTEAEKYYLKYVVHNNIASEKYMCFVISDTLAQANAGVIAGEYCLRGSDGGAAFNYNVNILKNVFDYANHSSRCTEESDGTDFRCMIYGHIGVRVKAAGELAAYNTTGASCYVSGGGSSACS